jgi:hypothetical protein
MIIINNNIVRWLIGNAPRQNVGEIAGSTPVLTTKNIKNNFKRKRILSIIIK